MWQKKKQLNLILLIGQGLVHSKRVGWGIFLKGKNPTVSEDYWFKTGRHLNCGDFERSILEVFQTLSSLISSQLLHICWKKQSHTLRKTEKRGRWVSNWLYHDTQEFLINKQEVQCRNQESYTKHKKELSHKWFLTSADNSDGSNTIPVWSIWQRRGKTSIHGDVMYAWKHWKIFLCFKDFA